MVSIRAGLVIRQKLEEFTNVDLELLIRITYIT